MIIQHLDERMMKRQVNTPDHPEDDFGAEIFKKFFHEFLLVKIKEKQEKQSPWQGISSPLWVNAALQQKK